MALSTDERGRYVAANDSFGRPLTSIARQQQLCAAGYEFEALAAQAAFVEAVALAYALCLRGGVPEEEAEELKKKLKTRKATFGSVVKAIRSAPSVDTKLKDDLRAYVAARNGIAHSMIASSTLVDLPGTYRIGERLIAAMPSPHTGYSAGVFVPYR